MRTATENMEIFRSHPPEIFTIKILNITPVPNELDDIDAASSSTELVTTT